MGERSLNSLHAVAANIKLAKSLAGNNKRTRDRALKFLKKWLLHKASNKTLTEQDLMVIWRGLFYTMWMCDKPLQQEECANNIAELLKITNCYISLLNFKAALLTFINNWHGIDQLRLDKFLMLFRRILRNWLICLNNERWDGSLIHEYNTVLRDTLLNTEKSAPHGIIMHFVEIHHEELAKVTSGKISEYTVTLLLEPFVSFLVRLQDGYLIGHISKFLFRHLLWQSEAGVEYSEKFAAWKEQGFPGGSIDAMEREEPDCSDSEDEGLSEEQNKCLDPRAGKVDVVLAQIPFDPADISRLLLERLRTKDTSTKGRKAAVKLVGEFEKFATTGKFPLGIETIQLREEDVDEDLIWDSVERYRDFETGLMQETVQTKPAKRKSNESDALDPIELQDETWKYQYKFSRNSGTWFVFGQNEQELEREDVPVSNGNTVDCSVPKKKRNKPKKEDAVAKGSENSAPVVSVLRGKRKSAPLKLIEDKTSPVTPNSVKRVKIALKLNRSQEIHEHHAQIMRSPAIPYDATKKPSKPLLKPSKHIANRFNPFYRAQKNV